MNIKRKKNIYSKHLVCHQKYPSHNYSTDTLDSENRNNFEKIIFFYFLIEHAIS